MAKSWSLENAQQESINAWTHGIGFLLSIPAGVVLHFLAASHRPDLLLACDVYSLSLVLLYLFSALSHAVRNPESRHQFRSLDQGFVYTLIAGTFTPIAWGAMDRWPRLVLVAGIWIAAIVGFYSKVFAKHRINNMSPIFYILLGWIPSMILFSYVSWECFATMAVGGVLYTFGTLFLHYDNRNWYYHAIWHLMVMVASATHYAAILMFMIFQIDGHR